MILIAKGMQESQKRLKTTESQGRDDMCKQANKGVPPSSDKLIGAERTRMKRLMEQEFGSTFIVHGTRFTEVSPEESSFTSDHLETDSNVIPDSSNICTNDNQVDQNAAEFVDERVALANLTLIRKEQQNIVQLILFIVDSGCTKHIKRYNLKLLCNFGRKFWGIDTIKVFIRRRPQSQSFVRVGQFCDADLEVAFKKSTCFVRDLQGNDLLTGNHRSDLYTISLQETTSSTPICFMAKASPTQPWHEIPVNKSLHAFFKEEGIENQTSTPRTPEQNDVVERRNHTLVEAARTMLSASKLPLSFWAEAVATACYYFRTIQFIITTHGKMS
ncbi:integrase, catalytic region, zinc finger, CCHC-type containing protein [Tanacetum coccineum]